jgi:hypothetical protein
MLGARSNLTVHHSIVLKVIQISLLLLPFTHFKWLPNLGLTRPLTAVGAVAAISLLFISGVVSNRWTLPSVPGWHVLRWYFLLLVFGAISVLATLIYGDVRQALTRLLGYIIIFSMLYMAMYIFRYRNMQWVARMVMLGYLPVTLYGVIEARAMLGYEFARAIVDAVRINIIVVDWWQVRLSLLASETSFLAFQLVLLLFCLPFLHRRGLRYSAYFLILLILLFSRSITVVLTVAIYVSLRFLVWGRFKHKLIMGPMLVAASFVATSMPFFTPITGRVKNIINDVAFRIRFSYVLNLLHSIIYSWGAGFGIGQYGLFWKDIYVAYIDYEVFDKYGEVAANLAGNSYMKPWSVVLGVGVDFGIIGLLVFLLFLYQVWKACLTAHDKAIFVTSFILIMGAYPIVTPHIWLVFAFIVAKRYSQHTVMNVSYQPVNLL